MDYATDAASDIEDQAPRDGYYGYMRVWDAPVPSQTQDGTSTAFAKEIGVQSPEHLNSIVTAVPEQQDDTIRVCFLELSHMVNAGENVKVGIGNDSWDHGNGGDVNTRQSDRIIPTERFLDDTEFLSPMIYTTSFMSFGSSGSGGGLLWYRLSTYELFGLPARRVFFWKGKVPFVHTERNICLRQHGSKRQALINCRPHEHSNTAAEPASKFRAASFAALLRGLHEAYRPFLRSSNWKLVFSLQYHHANLLSYSNFVVFYEEMYMSNDQLLLDPRRSDFRPGHLKRITKHSCSIQQIAREGDRMMTAIKHLVDKVKTQLVNHPPESTQAKEQSQFAALEQEILGHCVETKGCLSRLSNSLEHDLRLLGLHREMKQTNSVQRLTMLATIFLPLSLSAGVLSMQTRVKELGALLYDFFGVTFILCTLIPLFMLLIYYVNFMYNQVLPDFDMASKENRRARSEYKHRWMVGWILLWFLLVPEAVLILVFFIVGMSRDNFWDLAVLAYGSPGPIALALFPILVSYLFPSLWKAIAKCASNVAAILTMRASQRRAVEHQEREDEEAARNSREVRN